MRRTLLVAIPLLFVSAAILAAEDGDERQGLHSDSLAPYIHRITLYDHDGGAIDPADELAPPYSPAMTCGKCHAVAQIAGGWHFNAMSAGVMNGRPGEPWILTDSQLGLQIPISQRGWAGTFKLGDVGLSRWEFVKRFGHHTPGGGIGAPSQREMDDEPESLRWNISGGLEIDCLFCHSAGRQHDPADAARQIERENFKWAPTVAAGLAVVRGDAAKMPDDWDPFAPPNPDFPDQSPPIVVYDRSRFDGDNRVFFDVTCDAPDYRCTFCHTTRIVEMGDDGRPEELRENWHSGRDVHLAAGLTCTDCHRNGIDHLIVRGYEGEQRAEEAEGAAYSCAGCHLGVDGADDPEVAAGGRYGAPHPQHRGLPPIHFEKLTCTACHSGPMPKDAAARIQTALAHGLGIASEDRSAADAPTIYEPVFMLASEEQVTVGRLMWPSLFARLVDDTLVPIATDQLHAAMTKAEVKPTGTGLDNEQIVAILGELAAEGFANGEAVFVRDGLMWRSGQAPAPHELAKPYTWALAHDVRPAEQALGAGGCTDCHSLGAPLFFGHVGEAAAVGEPLQVLELYGGEEDEARIWGFVFIFRPLFKWYGWACVLLITIVLGSAAIAAVAPRNNHDVPPEPALDDPLKPLEKLVHVAAMLATAALAITGIGGWLIEGRVSEWMLLIHMSCSGLFLISLVAVAFVWSHRCWPGSPDYSAPRRFVFWLALLLGLVSAVSMLSAMLPVVGYGGQAVILVVHRYTGIAFVLLMVIHTILSRRVKTPAEVS